MSGRNAPQISVLMSVYNGEKFIARALLSILSQTYDDFELIIVDDGSSDQTGNIISSFKNDRIVLLKQPNSGLTRALNYALSHARGRWIARHDADDFSVSTRFEEQLSFLRANPKVRLLGSSCYIQPSHGIVNEVFRYPSSYKEICAAFLTYNPFVHGSMMIDRELLVSNGGYDERYRYAQDYELWSRLIVQTECFNILSPLYVRSVHANTSELTVDKKNIFAEVRDNFLRLNPAGQFQPDTDSRIESISIYPLVTLKDGYNKRLTQTFRDMQSYCNRFGLPSFKLRLQSLIYSPWSALF